MTQISISIADWVFDSYLQNLKNRSQVIEKAIILMSELEEGSIEETKKRNLELHDLLKEKQNEINELNKHNGRLKMIIEDMKQNYEKKKQKTLTETKEEQELSLTLFEEKDREYIEKHIKEFPMNQDDILFRLMADDYNLKDKFSITQIEDFIRKLREDATHISLKVKNKMLDKYTVYSKNGFEIQIHTKGILIEKEISKGKKSIILDLDQVDFLKRVLKENE